MPERIETIIINCSTKEQTTLALLSAVANGGLPVTIIDCESTDGSVEFFRKLQSRIRFTLTEMPLRWHGDSLDRIFAASASDALLLLDSDAEIVRPDLVPRLVHGLDEDAYGSGFVHAGEWLEANHLVGGRVGYYAPRMWIPCVLLKVAPIRAALAADQSFRARSVGNEIARMPRLSQLLHLRFRLPVVRRLRLDWLRSRHGVSFGEKPHYIFYDTGAALHQHLSQASGLHLADLGKELWASAVRHHHGVTRRRLKRTERNAADFETTRREAIHRIETVYGEVLPRAPVVTGDFGTLATNASAACEAAAAASLPRRHAPRRE